MDGEGEPLSRCKQLRALQQPRAVWAAEVEQMDGAIAASSRQQQQLARQEAGLHGGNANLAPEYLLLLPHVLRIAAIVGRQR